MAMDDGINIARDLISSAERIIALTGAGISVDSGIPDFRSEGGLWDRYDPYEYGTYESFQRDPSKFWTMGRELAEVLLKGWLRSTKHSDSRIVASALILAS